GPLNCAPPWLSERGWHTLRALGVLVTPVTYLDGGDRAHDLSIGRSHPRAERAPLLQRALRRAHVPPAYTAPLQVDASQTTVASRPRRGGARWRTFPRMYSGGRRSVGLPWC